MTFVKDENDNPTIGILLCTETDKVLAKYSVLNGSEQLLLPNICLYADGGRVEPRDRTAKTFLLGTTRNGGVIWERVM